MKQAQKVFPLLLTLVCSSVIPLQADNAKSDIDKVGNRHVARRSVIPKGLETHMGDLAAARLERAAKIVQDRELNDYVNRVAASIAANSDFKSAVTLKVIDAPTFNASCLPGGHLYVTTGMLRNLDNEAQLAAALSHEIGHLAARHGASQATKKILMNGVGFLPFGATYVLATDVATPAVPLTLAKFSRGQELEADLLGLQYVYKAGYDPQALVQLLEKVEKAEANAPRPSASRKAFDTHPQMEARIAKARQEIRDLLPQRECSAATNAEFARLRDKLLHSIGNVQLFPNQGAAAQKLSPEGDPNSANGQVTPEPDIEPASDVKGEGAIDFTPPVLDRDGQRKIAPNE